MKNSNFNIYLLPLRVCVIKFNFRFTVSPEVKRLTEERKMYLNRSRKMYLRNLKLVKKINSLKKILNEDTISYDTQEDRLTQSKITCFFAKKSAPSTIKL